MEDDRIVLLPANNGDVGAEMELQAADNSSEGQGTEEGGGGVTDAAARSADPMDRDPAFIVYVAAVTAAVGGLLFGYDMGTDAELNNNLPSQISFNFNQVSYPERRHRCSGIWR